MTTIYFVRHAQPDFKIEDAIRPLTEEGEEDTKVVLDFFADKEIDAFYCSPYKRSVDTILSTAKAHGKEIFTDPRLREREKGPDSNFNHWLEKRWADFSCHEEGGESIEMVQERNVAALFDILRSNKDKTLVVGTHGTALSTILNYFDPSYGLEDFLRIIDWMPFIVQLDFDEEGNLVNKTEHVHVEKEFID